MQSKTFIKGKDSDLETSIEGMYSKLNALDIVIDKVSTLNPIPYVYSQYIQDNTCEIIFTNGKGSCEKSCLASALGEYFERLSCNYFFADYYLGERFAKANFVHYPNEKWFHCEEENNTLTDGLLDDTLWSYYNPDGELHQSQLFDTNSGAGERGICTLPFTRQRDNKTIYFPVNIIGNLYVSNGMAAGNTEDEARVQAICEIFERYVKNKIIAEGISLPQIPQHVLDKYPQSKASIEKLKDEGFHLKIADASLGGIYPVISVTLINPKEGTVFASFGAHPSFGVALERTITELLQGRSLNMFDDFHSPSFNMDEISDPHNLETHFINATGLISYNFFKQSNDYTFVDWDSNLSTKDEFTYLCQIASTQNVDIYIADYEHLGVYACRILIPSISEIYPVEDLFWSNNNEGAYFREALLNLKHLSKVEILQVLENLEEGNYDDMRKVAEFIGIIPDKGTAWETLQIGELKAMLFLAIGEHESAKEWLTWCNHIALLNNHRQKLYKCLHAILEIILEDKDFDEYKKSLEMLYSHEIVQLSLNIIETKETFYGLHSPGLSLKGFIEHQKLLDAYEKVHKAKDKYVQFNTY